MTEWIHRYKSFLDELTPFRLWFPGRTSCSWRLCSGRSWGTFSYSPGNIEQQNIGDLVLEPHLIYPLEEKAYIVCSAVRSPARRLGRSQRGVFFSAFRPKILISAIYSQGPTCPHQKACLDSHPHRFISPVGSCQMTFNCAQLHSMMIGLTLNLQPPRKGMVIYARNIGTVKRCCLGFVIESFCVSYWESDPQYTWNRTRWKALCTLFGCSA